MGHISVVITIW